MGNSNSREKRKGRRRRRRHNDDRRQEPVRNTQHNFVQSRHKADVIEQRERAERVSRAKSLASEAPNLKRFPVELVDHLNPGFKVDEQSLMIIEVSNPMLQEQMLPQGSIIREVDRIPVYEWSQFCSHVENKRRYLLSVLVPSTTGVWKVRPNSKHRQIIVHPESLSVSTNLQNFPSELQVVRCVNGASVRTYEEYTSRTKGKEKFFITVAPANNVSVSAASVTTHLEALRRFPQAVSEHEINLVRETIEEALLKVRTELDLRTQVFPPLEEQQGFPPQPPAAAFTPAQVPHEIPVEHFAIPNDVDVEYNYEEQEELPRKKKKRKKSRRRRKRIV